ncbi:MAG: hypothetical protein HEQ35_00715 [Gloeotrichia echinulata IR180]
MGTLRQAQCIAGDWGHFGKLSASLGTGDWGLGTGGLVPRFQSLIQYY